MLRVRKAQLEGEGALCTIVSNLGFQPQFLGVSPCAALYAGGPVRRKACTVEVGADLLTKQLAPCVILENAICIPVNRGSSQTFSHNEHNLHCNAGYTTVSSNQVL